MPSQIALQAEGAIEDTPSKAERAAKRARKLTRKQQAREARRQAAIACHNEHQKGETK